MKASYHHGDLRQALVDASVRILASRDAGDLSLREVARQAGVSAAAPYHHFGSKLELLAAIGVQGFALLEEELREAARHAGPGRATLEACILGYVRFALAHPSHFRVMHHPELRDPEAHPDLHEQRQGIWRYLGDQMAAPQSFGSSLDAEQRSNLMALAWSTAHGLARLLVGGALCPSAPPFPLSDDPDAVARTVASTFGSLLERALPTK